MKIHEVSFNIYFNNNILQNNTERPYIVHGILGKEHAIM